MVRTLQMVPIYFCNIFVIHQDHYSPLKANYKSFVFSNTIIEKAVLDRLPFLSIVWFHAPHLPVLTGKKYKSLYSGLSEDEQEYYGVITALDEQVGRLRNKLKSLNIYENTLVFYTSDNGPETQKEVREGKIPFGRTRGVTNGLRGRKRSLYEGGIRVPGIVEWPRKIRSGTVINVPC